MDHDTVAREILDDIRYSIKSALEQACDDAWSEGYREAEEEREDIDEGTILLEIRSIIEERILKLKYQKKHPQETLDAIVDILTDIQIDLEQLR